MKNARHVATNRTERRIDLPLDREGNPARVSEIFGENTFDFRTAEEIPDNLRQDLIDISTSVDRLPKELADVVARSAMNWALSKGATHFCHWFQPLTGLTAEKHDAFIDFKDGSVIENLSAGQLMQGEPDASSFPHGGSRSTFEARGYTTWDLTSPLFLMEGTNGKTLCIPTAFVSYHGDALDLKTPLLRSEQKLSESAVRFLKASGHKDVQRVHSNCGPEQEYFLVDKAFYNARPDLLMTGRTLIGHSSPKNQQLSDQYFGDIPERVLSMMQELDLELHRLGIPAKTRHNEVAPGQFEIAPIFQESNLAADSNQIVMATIKKTAKKHNFQALFHEKPFIGVNGSGKHLNWSMGTDTGANLLSPGDNPARNFRFLSVTAVVLEALYRHSDIIRASIASAGNDHRLGANEAPPSIMSAFVGERLKVIIDAIIAGEPLENVEAKSMDPGARQLASLARDDTDRNRTSPFAFTGNRFEFRSCGSNEAIGLPLAILNAAVADVLDDSADFIEAEVAGGASAKDSVKKLTKKWLTHSEAILFNGDGYSEEWVAEAERRGLPNLRNTPAALPVLNDEKANAFLRKTGVLTAGELATRYNVATEVYCTKREIEFRTLISLVRQYVMPAVVAYKGELLSVISRQMETAMPTPLEADLLSTIDGHQREMFSSCQKLEAGLDTLPEEPKARAEKIGDALMLDAEAVTAACNALELLVADEHWRLPTQVDMLFLR